MVLFLSATTLCWTQDPDTWSWNVQGAWIRPIAANDFSSIPGVPTPGDLLYKTTSNPPTGQVAVGVDGAILPQLRIGGRLRYASLTLRYRADERVPIANPDGPGIYRATIAHDLETHSANVDVVPYLRYEPLSWLAVELATPIIVPLSSRYQQRMFFVDPVNTPFLDGSTERITGQGTIPSLAFASLAIQGRMEGIIPLTQTGDVSLTPFVALQQSLTSPASNSALGSTVVSIGIGLRRTFHVVSEVSAVPLTFERRETILRDTTVELSRLVKQPQTVLMSRVTDSTVADNIVSVTTREMYTTFYPKPPAILRASVKLAFVHNDGTISDDASVSALRVRTTHAVQLLPIIVFDEEATTLPLRYVKLSSAEAATWKPTAQLLDAPTHWQYTVHNVIGSRLRSTRGVCSLFVYHNGTEQGKQRADQRLQALRRYMRETFSIDERRLPARYDRAQGLLAQSIVFDPASSVVTPLTSTQMLNDTELPSVQVIPDVASEASVERWAITVQTNGRTVRVISDSGAVPQTVSWNMNDDLQSEARQQDVDIYLEVVDRDSAWVRSEPATIRLRSQATSDRSMIPLERTDYLDLSSSVDGVSLPQQAHKDAVRVSLLNNTTQWYLRGLVEPELSLYQRAILWRKQERRP